MLTIGVPTEIKTGERRVALTPADCAVLTSQGYVVYLQKGAGISAGFADDAYEKAGVTLQPTAAKLYEASQLIVKVKEPQKGDLKLLTKHHTLFCYLHLAAEPELIEELKKIELNAYGFETVKVQHKTPLLAPMSAIAGRLATQIGTWHLHAPRGGRGVLLGGIQKTPSGQVVVIGAGVAGTEAAVLAAHMGANVIVLDIAQSKLEQLEKQYPHITTGTSNSETINTLLPKTDLLIGAVYVIGKKAPIAVKKEQLKLLPKGAVIVDISIDQGGCIEGSEICTHDTPVYEEDGLIRSAIANLPAAAPYTASTLLSKAITPYVEQLAKNDLSPELAEAINVSKGRLKLKL